MDSLSPDDGPSPAFATPEAHFDALRDHPEWTDRRRAEELDLLVRRFPPDRCMSAVRGRLGDLHGGDAEPMLRLIEAYPTPELLRELAEAVVAQDDLSPERAWDALALLEGHGMLEGYPALLERWQELNEALDEDGSIHDLAEGLEGDPDGIWLALQGLGAVEPEVRAEIVASLAQAPPGPGLIEFLRLLCYCHDPTTRAAALDALGSLAGRDPRLVAAWTAIAADPPGPEASSRAGRWLGTGGLALTSATDARPPRPEAHPLHGHRARWPGPGRRRPLDGVGRDRTWPPPTYATCSRASGKRSGRSPAIEPSSMRSSARWPASRTATASRGPRNWHSTCSPGGSCSAARRPPPPFATGSSGRSARASGRVPSPCPSRGGTRRPCRSTRPRNVPGRSSTALPTWLDTSRLTYDLAEEIVLREGDSAPDPRRDAGAYRYMFEHRLVGQLELYRRMLSWMASFWEAAGDPDRGKSALASPGSSPTPSTPSPPIRSRSP